VKQLHTDFGEESNHLETELGMKQLLKQNLCKYVLVMRIEFNKLRIWSSGGLYVKHIGSSGSKATVY
jgi:hypothetical protein